jgi:hypothetical protein
MMRKGVLEADAYRPIGTRFQSVARSGKEGQAQGLYPFPVEHTAGRILKFGRSNPWPEVAKRA